MSTINGYNLGKNKFNSDIRTSIDINDIGLHYIPPLLFFTLI